MKRNKIGEQELEQIVKNSTSLKEVMVKFGLVPIGGNYSTIKKIIENFKIDTSHFLGNGWSRGKNFGYKKSISFYFENKIFITSDALKKRLIKEKYFEHKCYICNKKTWRGTDIPIELHHKDGNNDNNNFNNLIILCPNCHAIEDKKCSKKGKKQLNKEDAINFIKDSNSASEVLKKCGLSTRSNNHTVIYKLMAENNLEFKKDKPKCKKKYTYNKRISKEKKSYFCPQCGNEFKGRGAVCEKCTKVNQRRVERPLYEQLLKELSESSYCAMGRKYGVSDNTIRKWIKNYEK